ncbi:hypothetical protein EQH89_02420 [Lacticaseibacillus paracasei]|uniref:hypothetical protein n=1 Tax=Lacticaseibacillus paracasei TaxID=1597 RepID=UPI000FF36EDA|nr:hypothetical protein [Lacticaseibacillus paracasei]RWZ62067.1 hypothetical protein EQH89_02420 [Lacticaseibacillus paracasei]
MINGNGLFVKFTDKEYIDSLLAGSLYFSKPRDFANASGPGTDGVRDPDEGAVVSKFSSDQYDIKVTSDNPKLNKLLSGIFSKKTTVTSRFVNESINYVRTCSLAFISFPEDLCQLHDGTFRIKKSVISGLKEIANFRPAVIYNAVCLEKGIEDFAKSLGTGPNNNPHHINKIRHDCVQYSDTSDRDPKGKIIDYKKMTVTDAMNVGFYKGLSFSSQKKYRIAISTSDTGNFTITIPLEAGSAKKIKSVDDLANCVISLK